MNFVLVELLVFILPLLLFAAWEVYSVSRRLDEDGRDEDDVGENAAADANRDDDDAGSG